MPVSRDSFHFLLVALGASPGPRIHRRPVGGFGQGGAAVKAVLPEGGRSQQRASNKIGEHDSDRKEHETDDLRRWFKQSRHKTCRERAFAYVWLIRVTNSYF